MKCHGTSTSRVQGLPVQETDVCHKKTDLKVFVVVIPKEGLAGWGPANPSLGMTPTIKYYSRKTASINIEISCIHPTIDYIL